MARYKVLKNGQWSNDPASLCDSWAECVSLAMAWENYSPRIAIYQRKPGGHWELIVDRSHGDGHTYYRAGYGGRIKESLMRACIKHDPRLPLRLLVREGCPIEVSRPTRRGRGAPFKPGYAWIRGWQVLNPDSGAWSVEMTRADASNVAARILKGLE